jgi:transposase
LLDSLQLEIKSMQKQIQSCIKIHPDLKRSSELLESIPGIGPSTIAQVLAFMGDLSRFDNAKQYAAFVGLNPREYCSGSSVRKQTRLSKTGNSALRKVFYMPALVAIKHNTVIQAFSERLKQSGKKPKVIVCAVMRKLVHIIYGILKSGEFFKSNLAT